jgi:hypothetical protein
MLPGPDQVLQCPSCAAAVLQPTISSGNTIGAIYYTDGYMDAPMFPQPAVLVRCPVCREPFLRAHAKTLGHFDRYGATMFAEEDLHAAQDPAWRRAPRVAKAADADYVPVLIRRRFTRETEVDLRIEYMQVCNHPRRQLGPDAPRPAMSAPERANLQMLASMLDLLNDEERLILAEVRRQLGEFDRAAAALAAEFPEDFALAAGRIQELVKVRNPWVAELFVGDLNH